MKNRDPNLKARGIDNYALEWIDKQREQFKRLGILGDWEKPYMTVDPQYEVGILKVLHSLTQQGLIRKGHKAVHWDWVFRTALAEAGRARGLATPVDDRLAEARSALAALDVDLQDATDAF